MFLADSAKSAWDLIVDSACALCSAFVEGPYEGQKTSPRSPRRLSFTQLVALMSTTNCEKDSSLGQLFLSKRHLKFLMDSFLAGNYLTNSHFWAYTWKHPQIIREVRCVQPLKNRNACLRIEMPDALVHWEIESLKVGRVRPFSLLALHRDRTDCKLIN